MKEKHASGLLISGSLALLLFACACQKKQVTEESYSIDRVAPSSAGTSQVLLKDFTVRTSAAFPFDIPAHSALPRLRGSYKCFVTSMGVQSREDAANIDFYVMTDEQYADFTHGDSGSVLFSANSTHAEHIDINLPPTMSAPQKYYVVFRNPPGGDAKKAVRADLSIDF